MFIPKLSIRFRDKYYMSTHSNGPSQEELDLEFELLSQKTLYGLVTVLAVFGLGPAILAMLKYESYLMLDKVTWGVFIILQATAIALLTLLYAILNGRAGMDVITSKVMLAASLAVFATASYLYESDKVLSQKKAEVERSHPWHKEDARYWKRSESIEKTYRESIANAESRRNAISVRKNKDQAKETRNEQLKELELMRPDPKEKPVVTLGWDERYKVLGNVILKAFFGFMIDLAGFQLGQEDRRLARQKYARRKKEEELAKLQAELANVSAQRKELQNLLEKMAEHMDENAKQAQVDPSYTGAGVLASRLKAFLS